MAPTPWQLPPGRAPTVSPVHTRSWPTGNTKAPYVGMIRYLEREYRCSDSRALDCRVEKTTPITEVFRFQDGRWIY